MALSKLFLAILLTISSCSSVHHVLAARELADEAAAMAARHEKWMAEQSRRYKDEDEKARRFEIFKSNAKYIDSFNAAGNNKKHKLATNRFADLTDDEFRATWTGYSRRSGGDKHLTKGTGFKYENFSVLSAPASLDWRTTGAVTGVKDQGSCGCCWAFSAVAAVEGLNKIRTGRLVSLSEQELVDCDVYGHDQGCEGGLMDDAFKFITRRGGLAAEFAYPYQASDGNCRSAAEATGVVAATIRGYQDVPANNEAALMAAVAHQPVSVAINGADAAFRFYSGGILSGRCGTDLNHAVTAVGYGTAADGTGYWLMKNSWGGGWGEGGYIRIKRGAASREGVCGLAREASYPV